MLARLILALLLAAFAVPAAAVGPCHDVSPAQPAAHAMPAHAAAHHRAPDTAAMAHSCIGCIPPSDWHTTAVATPLRQAGVRLAARAAVLGLGEASPPALPPPRIA